MKINHSIWQSEYRKNLLETSGQAEIFEIDGILVEKRSIGLRMYGLFVIGISPNIHIPEKKLIDFCKQEKALFVQLESYTLQEQTYTRKFEYFMPWYYKKFITPYTITLDLTQDATFLLKSFHKKCQYNIRLAEKKGVYVKKVEKTEENIDIFFDLIIQTTKRNGFSGNSKKYYSDFLETIPESELFFAYFEEKVICGGIFVYTDTVGIYYYGASDRNYSALMAPYLVQWKSILYAQERWCAYYDFMGIASPGEQKSSLAGVTAFKKRFSSQELLCSESVLWVRNRMVYFFVEWIRKIRNAR